MTEEKSITDQIGELSAAIRELGERRVERQPEGKASDGGSYAAALDGSKDIADEMVRLNRELQSVKDRQANAEKAEATAAAKAELRGERAPSMAEKIGQRPKGTNRIAQAMNPTHPWLKGLFGDDYQGGSLLSAVYGMAGNPDDFAQAKATLADLGVEYMGLPEFSKATLGTTGATGGYVLPNNLVDGVIKPAVQEAVLQSLVTVRNGVAVRGVDQPYRMGAPARMTFQDWGATKENVNETYGSYSANLGTMARIYDLSKQYLRFSAGSAEQDVLDELTKAAVLGENYYMIAGAGTGSTGTGDPTTGIYTSLNATPAFLGYKAAKTGAASNSTVAGAFAQACVELMALLASRSRRPTAILVDATTFFTAIGQGSDTAGFWVSPTGGPTGFTRTESGGLAFWGVPIYYDVNLGTNAATKIAIAAEFDAFRLLRGMEFRIDSSDQAGTRWDQNLVGFRGEQEIGFNADSAVHVGAAQLMTAVIP